MCRACYDVLIYDTYSFHNYIFSVIQRLCTLRWNSYYIIIRHTIMWANKQSFFTHYCSVKRKNSFTVQYSGCIVVELTIH